MEERFVCLFINRIDCQEFAPVTTGYDEMINTLKTLVQNSNHSLFEQYFYFLKSVLFEMEGNVQN